MNEAVAQDLYETINHNAIKIIKLKEQNKEMLGSLKDISGELKLSNDQNTLAIDGCHMNILVVWDEIDKLIEKIEGEQNG